MSCLVLVAFLLTNSGLPALAHAKGSEPANLVALGMRLNPSGTFRPPLLVGIKVYADNPFRFDFILDHGDAADSSAWGGGESGRLIQYFLAALTIPEQDIWVNLSPYEKGRLSTAALGRTGLGHDMVAQDYLLKQLAVSMLDPDSAVGKEFWGKVYEEAYRRYGTTDIPIDTFNKLWIVPERAEVFESTVTSGVAGTQALAYVTGLHLKVLLQVDAAQTKTAKMRVPTIEQALRENKRLSGQDLSRQILYEIVVPFLEKEVNEGENFAKLRQICYSVILATWYKRKIKASLLSAVYFDKEKLEGITAGDPAGAEKIWQQYVEVFEKGARNYIKEERYQFFGGSLPRKFFTGGVSCNMSMLSLQGTADKALAASGGRKLDRLGVYLSSLFRRSFRFGLDERDLAGQFYDVYKKLLERNGRARLRLSQADVWAHLKMANQLNAMQDNSALIKTYAYMGYAALLSALVTHFVDNEESGLAARFLLFGPAQAYFRYVGGGIDKLSSLSAFLTGMVMSAAGGSMFSTAEIMALGRAGYFLSIMPAGSIIDDGITFPAGEVWLKRDLYNAEFMISEHVAREMAHQLNLPNHKLFSHAYGYLLSSKLGFHDYTYGEEEDRKVSVSPEQAALELASQLAKAVLNVIPRDLREQEVAIRKLSLAFGEGAASVSQMRAGRMARKEGRSVIDQYLREEIVNRLAKRDYVIPKFATAEPWMVVYGYALAKVVSHYYHDPDKSLAFLYHLSVYGDVSKAVKAVEKKYGDALYLSNLAFVGLKVGKYSQGFVENWSSANPIGNALRFNVSPDVLEQYRATVGFDPVILSVSPLPSLSKFLSFSDM